MSVHTMEEDLRQKELSQVSKDDKWAHSWAPAQGEYRAPLGLGVASASVLPQARAVLKP